MFNNEGNLSRDLNPLQTAAFHPNGYYVGVGFIDKYR
jgi:hypothetical protein